MSEEETRIAEAIRRYNEAIERQDADAQLDFFAATWRAGDMDKNDLAAYTRDEIARGDAIVRFFDPSRATIVLSGDEAKIDQVRLRSPTGGGSFEVNLIREADDVWRCSSMRLSPNGYASSPVLTSQLGDDPHRPGYHFVADRIAMPFDPNGAIFWRGRYHLFYIYQESIDGTILDHWGHASSTDLIIWRDHPTGLRDGMYSGNCFINAEGVPTICYHQKGEGNAMAIALDDDLDRWQKLEVITPTTHPGEPFHDTYQSWDPCTWFEDGEYFAIFGGRRPGIAKSASLQGPWYYTGDLFAHWVDGVALDEDVSCPDFFELDGWHVLLCISHRMGCRYYIGEWHDGQFFPTTHRQMSWVDHSFFAPESLVDDRGRRIMWAWILDEPHFGVRDHYGWSGTLSLPRVLTIEEGVLQIGVPEELEQLRRAAFSGTAPFPRAGEIAIDTIEGSSLEIEIETVIETGVCGIKVCCGEDEETVISFDADRSMLEVDTRRSGPEDTPKAVESAPLELKAGEPLRLRVFVDRSIVEVFANGRQAIARRIYPSSGSCGVSVFSSRTRSVVWHAYELEHVADSANRVVKG